MDHFVVALFEHDATEEILFNCQADNFAHAEEQALDAYPEAAVTLIYKLS